MNMSAFLEWKMRHGDPASQLRWRKFVIGQMWASSRSGAERERLVWKAVRCGLANDDLDALNALDQFADLQMPDDGDAP